MKTELLLLSLSVASGFASILFPGTTPKLVCLVASTVFGLGAIRLQALRHARERRKWKDSLR